MFSQLRIENGGFLLIQLSLTSIHSPHALLFYIGYSEHETYGIIQLRRSQYKSYEFGIMTMSLITEIKIND